MDDNRDTLDVLLPICATVVVLVALSGYLLATWRLRRRGDHSPVLRTLSCVTACAGLVMVALMPLPGPAFTVHMVEHTIVGMAAPVLVALARPVTLMLRALPPGRGRRALLALLHSRMASLIVFPPLAAVWDVGGLWVLYRTPLFATVHGDMVLHAFVYVHVFAAGLLFAVAVTQLEPVGRRYSLPLRAASLVLAAAAHDVLSKSIYAAPPPDTAAMLDAADVQTVRRSCITAATSPRSCLLSPWRASGMLPRGGLTREAGDGGRRQKLRSATPRSTVGETCTVSSTGEQSSPRWLPIRTCTSTR